jgi:hypothetical protein
MHVNEVILTRPHCQSRFFRNLLLFGISARRHSRCAPRGRTSCQRLRWGHSLKCPRTCRVRERVGFEDVSGSGACRVRGRVGFGCVSGSGACRVRGEVGFGYVSGSGTAGALFNSQRRICSKYNLRLSRVNPLLEKKDTGSRLRRQRSVVGANHIPYKGGFGDLAALLNRPLEGCAGRQCVRPRQKHGGEIPDLQGYFSNTELPCSQPSFLPLQARPELRFETNRLSRMPRRSGWRVSR